MEAVRHAVLRPRLVDDEATLTVVRFTLLGDRPEHLFAHGAETQPREKEKVLFYPVVICSRLARVPINMQIGNTHPS